ncbi:hypothetical protein DSO57_1001783 [Entomophthora muscae]|uniref:Uncharacterized protein n=1 Tax=Entomophthora muscae TaxID=34485 RepID=A0ACC2T8X3_9FUNG|nr:hypothetical protein DSO57_1001783 [Entomophthora muscae]
MRIKNQLRIKSTELKENINFNKNIPDINQILTERKSWGKIAETPTQGAKFDKEFPPLLEENKNKIVEKLDLSGRWANLSSGQAPTATAQTPATPASTQPASRHPARHPSALTRLLASRQPPSRQPGPCRSPACLLARPPARPAASVPATSPCCPPARLPSCQRARPQPTRLLPGPQPAACHPPRSQGPPCNQSEIPLEYSQSS